ncbi:MAG: hypothetical protein IK115_05040 [Lachnospiraceae bacterium]|nr:hypothetical protein [Lachnospiraceae bacterium]
MRKSDRGSLTLEAALVLPLYLFFFLALLSGLEMLRHNAANDYDVSRTVKKLAVYAAATGPDIIELPKQESYAPRGNAFGIPSQRLLSVGYAHAWTGYQLGSGAGGGGDSGERMVYITETGTVYHLTRSCTHLKLSITAVSREALATARNGGGGRYRPCEICGGGNGGTVFITNEGDRYHSSLGCSGLKRTIYEIPISQVGGRRCCSRCGGRL